MIAFVDFFKRTQPEVSQDEMFSEIKKSVKPKFGLSDDEIRNIIRKNF